MCYSLVVSTKSWNKNSFGLFDYESKDIQKKNLKVVGTSNFNTYLIYSRQTAKIGNEQGISWYSCSEWKFQYERHC